MTFACAKIVWLWRKAWATECAQTHGGAKMAVEQTDTLVVGTGQSGVAMSEHLAAQGIPHLVLERRRIAERWRSER